MSINRRFGIFIAGSFLASFGGWINFLTILNIAVWRFSATPYEFVLLSAAMLLPSVLLGRAIGYVCARYVGSAVIVLLLAVTLLTTAALMAAGNFTVFLAVVGLKSAALSFIDPWEMRYVTVLFDKTQQTKAFRSLTFTQNVAKIGAPAAGTVVGAWEGDGRTLLLSIALIAVAMVCMRLSAPWRLQAPSTAADERPHATYAKARGPLVPLLYCAATSFAMSSAISNQFPLMLKVDGFGKAMLGLLVSCSALGGIVGSALWSRGKIKAADVGSLAGPALASAVLFIAIGGIFRLPLYPAQFLLGATFFGAGWTGARFRISCRLYVSQRFPDTVAEASAMLQSCGMLAQFIAPFGGALLISYLSPSNVFIFLGTTATIILLLGRTIFWRKQLAATRNYASDEQVFE